MTDYLPLLSRAVANLENPEARRKVYDRARQALLAQLRGMNPPLAEAEITRDEMGFEFMLNALRLTDGFDPNLFAERTGLTINAVASGLDAAEAKGLLYRDHKLIKPTELGQRFLNDLQQLFLAD